MSRESKRDHLELQRLRRLIGWTQPDLAKAAGICRTRISLFENGHIDLAPQEVTDIESVLKRAADGHVAAVNQSSRSSDQQITACFRLVAFHGENNKPQNLSDDTESGR